MIQKSKTNLRKIILVTICVLSVLLFPQSLFCSTPFTCAHLSSAVHCHQSLPPQYLVSRFVHRICQLFTVTDLLYSSSCSSCQVRFFCLKDNCLSKRTKPIDQGGMQGQEHVACRRRQILAEQNKPPWTPSEAAAGDKETGETNGETEEEAYLAATCAGSSPKISSMAAWCTILAPSQSSTYSGNLWTGYSWNMSVTSLATLSLSQGPAPSKQS